MASVDAAPLLESRLLDCSNEVLQNILTFIEPADLGPLARSCRSLNAFICGNRLLCRDLYLRRYDPPALSLAGVDWERELRKLVKLERMLASSDAEYKRSCLGSAAEAICAMVSAPEPTKNLSYLVSQFKSRANVDALLTGSSLYEHAGTRYQRPADTPELRQLAAKLHVYFGIPVDQEHTSPPVLMPQPTTGPSYQVTHAESDPNASEDGHYLRSKSRVDIPVNYIARAKVYDLREYTIPSLWGPFKSDGSLEVDWEKMEAIMVLMGHNLRASLRLAKPRHTLWYGPWEGISPGSFPSRHEERSTSKDSVIGSPDCDNRSAEEKRREAEQLMLDEQDPYGVSGTWLRVVCFLDYNDLYAFNFTNERRASDRQRGIATDEAIRLICIKLRVTKVVYPSGPAQQEDSDSSSDYDGENLKHKPASGAEEHAHSDKPIVYFEGTSRSLHASWDPNANSRIRGMVQTTPHGDVRWTTWSIFHGEERWRSEGVQIGGPRSRRGILGNWFDKDYDHYGPAGPTAFWKVSNDIETHDRSEGGADRNSLDLLRFLWRVGPDSDAPSDDSGDEMEWGDEDEVEVIDETLEEVEYEFVGTEEDLMEELRALREEEAENE